MRTRKCAMAVAACLSWLLVGAAWAQNAPAPQHAAAGGFAAGPGPKEQFKSVIYVRKDSLSEEQLRQLKPDSWVMGWGTLADVRAWGGAYKFSWFNLNYVSFRDNQKNAPPPDPANADAYVEGFTQSMWDRWDEFRAAGVVTGERPPNYEDLFAVTEAYATALRDGAPLPERVEKKISGDKGQLCISNPAAVRIMSDIMTFNAKHCFKPDGKHNNGGFVDMDVLPRHQDYSEYSRKKFEAWLRAAYKPEEIRALLQADPAGPISLLAPKGASPDLARVHRRLQGQFFNDNWAEFTRKAIMDPIEAVVGKGNFHLVLHGDGYGWRWPVLYMNMVWWGDVMSTYCTECGRWPGLSRSAFYASPQIVNGIASNVYDYQYGAGRLWGEPVMVKTIYAGTLNNRRGAELGVAEGMALLGNMGIYAAGGDKVQKRSVPASWVLPMVEFAHKLKPQFTEMIPAARIGVVFSAVDRFAGFLENDEQAFLLSGILHRAHAPLQVLHLQLLDRTLAARPMDVVVVPWLRCVQDSQAAYLTKFVENGGKVVFIGDECGAYTWEAVKRDKPAFAAIMPPTDARKVTTRQVGKGRTALVPGRLDNGSVSAQNVQQALFEVAGATPSCIRPDQFPGLLTNLTRNSDDSRCWMHLVNYDADVDAPADLPIKAPGLENVRVVIPLPEGLKAQKVVLYRPGADDLTLVPEHGLEGCAVTVPAMSLYALVRVETGRGTRPADKLLQPADLAEALKMVALGMGGAPARKTLIAPQGPPAAEVKFGARHLRTRDRLVAYATSQGGAPIQIKFDTGGGFYCTGYASDGSCVAPSAATTEGQTSILSFAAPAAGAHLAVVVQGEAGRVEFTHKGGACFEASAASPLGLWEEGNSEPLYFYVPKGCKSFKLATNTQWDSSRIYPVRVLVKDGAGETRLDVAAPFPGMKPHEIAVPVGRAGSIWSLTPLEPQGSVGASQAKKAYLQFYFEGVPPLVAQSPSRLLIAKGDE